MNPETGLRHYLQNLDLGCCSEERKEDTFKNLSSLIMKYILQLKASGELLEKSNSTHVILEKLNIITKEHVKSDTSGNNLQEVQVYIANILSPTLPARPDEDVFFQENNVDSTTESDETVPELSENKIARTNTTDVRGLTTRILKLGSHERFIDNGRYTISCPLATLNGR